MCLCLPKSTEVYSNKYKLLQITSASTDAEARDNFNIIIHPRTYCKKEKILQRTTQKPKIILDENTENTRFVSLNID